jgi:putative ABC transport system substrate-binding protein
MELRPQPDTNAAEIRAALANLPATVEAIFLPRDSTVEAQIAQFTAIARQRGLPIAAPSLSQVQAGALFSYGFIHHEIGRQAARLAAEILGGTPPGELPVEMAESYLAINLRTARAIGLEIPDAILLQAERIIRE